MKVEIEVYTFPDYLRACLGAVGMTQRDLAKAMGYSQSAAVCAWCSGSKQPSHRALVRICQAVRRPPGVPCSGQQVMDMSTAAVLLVGDVARQMHKEEDEKRRARKVEG